MFLFLKLYLAHLVADFVLQFDELYRLKLKSLWGHILHALIHAALSLLFLAPFLAEPFIWIFVFLIAGLHLFQDVFKYTLVRNKKYHFPIFALDQVLHLLFIATIALFPIGRNPVSVPPAGLGAQLYFENSWTYFLIVGIAATMAGAYTLHAFSFSYLKDHRKDRFISRAELIQGFLERSVAAGIFFLASNPLFWLLAPAGGIFRIFFPRLRNARDFLVSFAYAVIVGILFRFLPLAVK